MPNLFSTLLRGFFGKVRNASRLFSRFLPHLTHLMLVAFRSRHCRLFS